MDTLRQRWRAIKKTIFDAEGLSEDQQLAAWRQLNQQKLSYVERLLDVAPESLTAVLRAQTTGNCAKTTGDLVMLTAKEYVQQQLPKLESEGESSSEFKARCNRTFEGLVPWEGFVDDVEDFTLGLDDTDACFVPLVFQDTHVVHGGTEVFGWKAADQREIRGTIFLCLRGISAVARRIGYEIEYIGGGSYRCISNTDLLLRLKGTTDVEAASRLILGVVEIKIKWELELDGSNNMMDVLHDPNKAEMALEVIQEAFGDAVMDEAPLLVVSNYEVTYFIRRDVHDVENKKLVVSPPISWDSQSPHPLAAWMYFLHLASKLWNDNVKTRLRRDEVPITPSCTGYRSAQTMYFLSMDGWIQVPEDFGQGEVSLANAQQHCFADVNCDVGFSSKDTSSGNPDRSGDPADSFSSSSASSHSGILGFEHQHWQSLVQAGSSEAVAALAVLPSSSFSYSDHILSASSSSVVVKGTVCGTPAALKIYMRKDDALDHFTTEVSAYLALQQQPCIVPLLAVGLLPHSGRPVIALAEGQPLSEQELSMRMKEAEEALQQLHLAGWSHGDVSEHSFWLYNKRVVLCNLERCAPITDAGREQDLDGLRDMLL